MEAGKNCFMSESARGFLISNTIFHVVGVRHGIYDVDRYFIVKKLDFFPDTCTTFPLGKTQLWPIDGELWGRVVTIP